MFAPRMAGDVKLLSKTCTETEVCVAFTLSGHFYSELDSKDKWTRVDNEDSVVFVAGVCVCACVCVCVCCVVCGVTVKWQWDHSGSGHVTIM